MSPELKDFLTGIAADPDRMTRYLADPEAEMAAAGLPEADRETLRQTDVAKQGDLVPGLMWICVPPPPPPPPTKP